MDNSKLQAPENKTIIISRRVHSEIFQSHYEYTGSQLWGGWCRICTTLYTVWHCHCTTEVLVLLETHFSRMTCERLWLKSGTSAKSKYRLVHNICDMLSNSIEALMGTIPFHAISASNTLSHIAGHGNKKKSADQKEIPSNLYNC